MKTFVKSHKEQLRLLLKNVLTNVILFGSWARGDASEDSDIDVAVIVRDGSRAIREKILHEVAELEFEHCQAISLLIFSDEELKRLADRERRIALDILNEGIQL